MKKFIPQNIKNYYHFFQAVLANFIYGFPSKKIKVIGITGTNGKTTTTQMIAKILEESGARVAMASTINFKIAEKEWVNKTKFTTLSAFSVQNFIKKAVDAGCDYLVLETSSHSLDQHRVWGIRYAVAVITNVTREHLDYHKNMDEYRIAKLRLFRGVPTIVVNLDMEKPRDYFLWEAKNKYGFSKREVDCQKLDCGKINLVRAENIKLEIDHSGYTVNGEEYELKLPGEFNVENALGATAVAFSQGISPEVVKKALAKIDYIPGRMYFVKNDKGFNVIIDYALTPDSLEKLYFLIDQIKNKRQGAKVIAVFGSCGERDRGKRPMMGKIVSEHADYVVVTNEDPYGEDPEQIINEVFSGVVGKIEGENCWRILDRREAIKKALQLARPGDIVVVTGKGAEEIMAVGEKRIPWNDEKVILEELGNI
ncbi:MAG: UDP-N-acetylmuramoyl-L-alanyl-D-glutamate--2,6-diaminopimelate ligase [Patescibacteria group bacterium]|nr:UDP-N-acetylmuramoyl-L-alanyl-D-glutamate--2,6-diaminopimelate ligase [Patescibacteria group bacterium]